MSGSNSVSTKQRRIAELAKQLPTKALTSLHHHLDLEWMLEAYRRTRKDGSPGVDGVTSTDYEKDLEKNLRSLVERAKSGRYRAPPVRRAYIPKAGGGQRGLGIPTLEDKILQRAVLMLLEPVFEEDFLSCSYGFRPGRSAHDALEALRNQLMETRGGTVLEVDIQRYFDELDHGHLQRLFRQRIGDGVVCRLIGKWLNAGVLEGGQLSYPQSGSPQGGVISPLLANIYLHEVLDKWFADQVRPVLKGPASLVRYADDFVLVFARDDDAQRVAVVLPKRFDKYGLKLHPTKTRILKFPRPSSSSESGIRDEPTSRPRSRTFDFLGFTHYWGRSRKGNWCVKKFTARDRVSRTLRRLWEWCRTHRHEPLPDQSKRLSVRLRGHYNYFGVTGNFEALQRVHRLTERIWFYWLRRRDQRRRLSWARFGILLSSHPLPRPRVVHSIYRPRANP
ncbi:MAG: group II intron reverse transcriptase/maturase [Methyloligella sp.]|nr:MAG: group II intron reverse transcriptase/maturase [Methyloligella sp.]